VYILVVNKNLKHYVIDKTAKSDLKNLVTRSLFGTATSIAGLVVLKEFDITLYAIASNFGPIMTVIFSYFLLRDKIQREDMLLLSIVMVGLAVKFSFPEHSTGSKHDAHKSGRSTFGYLCLAYIPVGIALSNILMRKMKKVHFIQLSIYKIIIALVITTIICVIR
jgi:drug/metabolite transporter (DMT)-like permease